MATTIEVVDGTAFQEAIASIRSDTTDDKFVICGHVDGDPNRIQVRSVYVCVWVCVLFFGSAF